MDNFYNKTDPYRLSIGNCCMAVLRWRNIFWRLIYKNFHLVQPCFLVEENMAKILSQCSSANGAFAEGHTNSDQYPVSTDIVFFRCRFRTFQHRLPLFFSFFLFASPFFSYYSISFPPCIGMINPDDQLQFVMQPMKRTKDSLEMLADIESLLASSNCFPQVTFSCHSSANCGKRK